MEVKIRPVSRKDFVDLVKLTWDIYPEASADPNFGDYVFRKRPSRQNIKKWLDKILVDVKEGNAIYCVAEANRHVVGQCFVRRDTPGSEIDHVGVLGVLVDKKHRGYGIGSKMLKFTIDKSRSKFEILHLRVFSSNMKAKKLYKRFGFKTFGVFPRSMKRGNRYIDRDFMYLEL